MFKTSQKLYILASVFLGILVTTIIHGVVEFVYIDLLLTDFGMWSFGLTWEAWYTIHHVFSILLLILGIFGGCKIGKCWWQSVYIKRKKGLFLKIK